MKYYSPVLEATKMPVNLYHYPGISAVPITPELLHNLEHYPNLAGIKDSTGNAGDYAAYVKEFPKLNMMTGTENNLPIALGAGMGAILVAGNLFPSRSRPCSRRIARAKMSQAAYDKMQEANRTLRVPGRSRRRGADEVCVHRHTDSARATCARRISISPTEQKAAMKPKLPLLKQLA